MDHRPKVKGKTMQHLEEKRDHIHDIGIGKDFLGQKKALTIRENHLINCTSLKFIVLTYPKH